MPVTASQASCTRREGNPNNNDTSNLLEFLNDCGVPFVDPPGEDGFEAGGLEDDATMRLLTGRNQQVGAMSKTHLDVTARAFHTGTKPEKIIAEDWRYRPRMHELEYDLADMYVRRRSVTHNRYLHGYKNQLMQLEAEIE